MRASRCSSASARRAGPSSGRRTWTGGWAPRAFRRAGRPAGAEGARGPAMSGERISLAFLSGPQSGTAVPLPRLPATLGSETDVDVVISGVAPRHCVLFRRDRDVVVLDSGSGLGTYLGDEAVQEAVLRDGDVLELGRGGPRLRFRREGHDRRAATPPLFRGRVSELSAIRLLLRTSAAFRWALVLLLVAGALLVGWGWRESRQMQREIASLRRAVHLAEEDRRVFQERVNVERARAE